MSSWKEDNLIKRFTEAEESNYLDELKQLINAEAVASWQYAMAAESIVGSKNFNVLKEHFTEHATEEWNHYSQLVAALMQRDEVAEMDLIATVQNALPQTKQIESYDCEYLREFFKDAEQGAIEAYQQFYDKIEDTDKDLADIIIKIVQDEKNHALDFSRLADEAEVSEEEIEPEEDVEEEPESEEVEEAEEDKDPITGN